MFNSNVLVYSLCFNVLFFDSLLLLLKMNLFKWGVLLFFVESKWKFSMRMNRVEIGCVSS